MLSSARALCTRHHAAQAGRWVWHSFAEAWAGLWTKPRQSIGCLNGIRALAVIWIVVHHAWQRDVGFWVSKHGSPTAPRGVWLQNHSNDYAWRVSNAGSSAVDVFFVLSGFLIADVLLRDLVQTGGVLRYKRFLWRRYLRIAPVLYVVVVYYALMEFSQQVYTNCVLGFALPMLFINNVFDRPGCVLWSWSIATEFQCYLFSPLVVFAFHQSRRRGYAALLAIASVSLIANYDYAPFAFTGSQYHSPVPRFFGYATGMAARFLHTRAPSAAAPGADVERAASADAPDATASASATSAAAQQPHQAFKLSAWYRWSVVVNAVLLLALLLLLPLRWNSAWWVRPSLDLVSAAGIYRCVTGQAPWIDAVLSTRLLYPIAVLSYDIYLVGDIAYRLMYHDLFGSVGHTTISYLQLWTRAAVVLLVAMLLSFLLHALIERPFMKLRQRRLGSCLGRPVEETEMLITTEKA